MAEVLHTHRLPNGHRLFVVASSSSGGGSYGHPYRLRLVETDGAPFTHIRARSVVRVIADHYANGRHRGPRSGWHATVEELRAQMHEEVDRARGLTSGV